MFAQYVQCSSNTQKHSTELIRITVSYRIYLERKRRKYRFWNFGFMSFYRLEN